MIKTVDERILLLIQKSYVKNIMLGFDKKKIINYLLDTKRLP